jgi:hypothetical protein
VDTIVASTATMNIEAITAAITSGRDFWTA